MMTHGQYKGICVRRSIPRKYSILMMATVSLFVWSLAVPSKNSYAIKSVIDQAQDQGFTDGMVREMAKLFPDSRALLRARELAIPPAPIAYQALSDYDRKVLEERLYNLTVDRFTADGMDIATLLVTYIGHMRFKVIVSVRTKELPYPKIRQTLERMRRIVDQDVLRAVFSGFELAELSSFTVLNRRNGRYYEYPVLYQNLAMPFFDGMEESGPRLKDGHHPGIPDERLSSPRATFPWGDRPWEARTQQRVTPTPRQIEGSLPPKPETKNLANQPPPPPVQQQAKPVAPAPAPVAPKVATERKQYPMPRALPGGSYTEQDFYGAPPAGPPPQASPIKKKY